MFQRLACIALASACLAWGCSADPMRAEPAAQQLAEAICDLGFRCCNEGEIHYYLSPFVSQEDCADRLVQSATLDPMPTFSVPIGGASITLPNVHALDLAIKDDRIRINRDALEECVVLLRGLTCNEEDEEEDEEEGCDPTLPEPPADPSPCSLARLVDGRVGEGGRCSSSDIGGAECQDELVCLRWAPAGVDGACGAPQQLGETCFGDGECVSELQCSMVDGTCQPFQQAGEECVFAPTEAQVPSPSTLLLRCAPGLTCSPFEEVCVGPCSRGYACSTGDDCAEDLACTRRVDSRDTMRSYCDDPHPAGGPCLSASDCMEGLTCEDAFLGSPPREGVCAEGLADGADCFSDVECQSGICSWVDAECTSPRANDLACSRNLECQSEFCFGSVCTPQASPGEPCPSGSSAECAGGTCVLGGFPISGVCYDADDFCGGGVCDIEPEAEEGVCVGCLEHGDCASGLCNLDTNQCLNACVALQADGEPCTVHGDCASGVCVFGANVCGTPPFPDGSPCASNTHCESGVCNMAADPPVCITPPLANGEPCLQNTHCESRVCFEVVCVDGAGEGETCGTGMLPCDPTHFYCDDEAEMPACAPIRETGEPCTRHTECRSNNCTLRYNRPMCSPAAPLDGLICDGA
jgi:hypothetical protein